MPHGFAARTYSIPVVTLDEVLAEEDDGLFLLKIDAQGFEHHILRGAAAYIRSHRICFILVEFYPQGLLAAGVPPLELLRLLHFGLGFQCFDMGKAALSHGAVSLEEFVAAHPARRKGFGSWTDLVCVDLTVM